MTMGVLRVLERNAAYWLKKAEEARTRADQMRDADAVATMMDIATKYDAMAQQSYGREVRSKTRAAKRRPSN
jgi:hypothetical protein